VVPDKFQKSSKTVVCVCVEICVFDDDDTHQYGVPMNVLRLPIVLSSCALTPKSTDTHTNRSHAS